MGFFSKIFSAPNTTDNSTKPEVKFGRYTDRNKTKEQLDSWTKCVDFFKEKKYVDSYDAFFTYLRDPRVDNVKFTRSGDRIDFEFIQGSKVVKGYTDNNEVFAEADVVKFDQPNVAVMRKLLTENYYLWFSKFTIRDNMFSLRHRMPACEAHPSTVYFSLKEVANVADSFDDVLLDEFPFLLPVNVIHIQTLPENEKKTKLKFFRETIENTLKRVDELNPDHFSGARAFLLLTMTYKMYYLLAPEGKLLDDVRYIQNIFFRQDDSTDVERNFKMIEEYKTLLAKSDEEISKSLYKVKATFAVVKPAHFTKVTDFVKDEINKINWYKDNKYPDIQQAICEYIVAYSCFNFGMEPIMTDIFHIFWHSLNFKYFEELGFKEQYYNVATEKLNQMVIEQEMNKIIASTKSSYPKLEFHTKNLNFNTKHDFATSFLYEFMNCNFEQ